MTAGEETLCDNHPIRRWIGQHQESNDKIADKTVEVTEPSVKDASQSAQKLSKRIVAGVDEKNVLCVREKLEEETLCIDEEIGLGS